MFTTIKSNLPILKNNDTMNNFLQNNTVIKGHRQPKNLKQLLTKAKFEDKPNNPHPKVFKCSRANCGICESIIERESFQFKNGSIFHVKSNMDCSSNNLLYVITCQGCGENYIGQTGNETRKRMTVHRQQIRDPNTRIRSGTPIPGSDQGPQYQNQIRDPNTRIRSGTPIPGSDQGPQYQDQIRDPNTRIRSGTPIPESDQGPQYQNQIRDPNTRIRSGTPIPESDQGP